MNPNRREPPVYAPHTWNGGVPPPLPLKLSLLAVGMAQTNAGINWTWLERLIWREWGWR